MQKKDFKNLGDLCLEVYSYLGGLNFDEKDFQIALGYELSKQRIEYLRETHIELFYKEIPIKLGAPDFYLSKERPQTIIEIKLGSSITNSNRQQLKMYLTSIKKNQEALYKVLRTVFSLIFLKKIQLLMKMKPHKKERIYIR